MDYTHLEAYALRVHFVFIRHVNKKCELWVNLCLLYGIHFIQTLCVKLRGRILEIQNSFANLEVSLPILMCFLRATHFWFNQVQSLLGVKNLLRFN